MPMAVEYAKYVRDLALIATSKLYHRSRGFRDYAFDRESMVHGYLVHMECDGRCLCRNHLHAIREWLNDISACPARVHLMFIK